MSPESARRAPVVFGILLLAPALVCAVLVPLGTYAGTLAVFGLAHVLSELRYVDLRFGPRFGANVKGILAAILFGIVAERTLVFAGWLPRALGVMTELGFAGGLCALAAGAPGVSGAGRALAGAGALGFGIAAILSPLHALMAFSVLHNLTPLGFLYEGLSGPRRRLGLAFAVLAMIGVPLFILTGIPSEAAAEAAALDLRASPMAAGDIWANIGVYLHPDFHDRPWALHLFSAAVYGQCAHYVATILVLPALLPNRAPPDGPGEGSVPWPAPAPFAAGVALMTIPLFIAYTYDFSTARSAYGIVAAVHAWIEIPLLLLALPLGLPEARRSA